MDGEWNYARAEFANCGLRTRRFRSLTDTQHPFTLSIVELMVEQGTSLITDVTVLHVDFWPEEESIEIFLETLYERRGHKRADLAA